MDNLLLEIGGKEYFIDVDALSTSVCVDRSSETEDSSDKDEETGVDDKEYGIKIDVAKYEVYRYLITTVLSTNDVVDDKMGMMGLNSLPIPFKLSFNTLLVNRIIKEL